MNKLIIYTDVTKRQIEEVDAIPREGAFICGLVLEGARWDIQAGQVEESKPREMYSPLPVIHCKAMVDNKKESNIFMCPVYKTEARGATYVFAA